MAKILDLMDNDINTIEELATATGLNTSAIGPLMGEILASKMDAVSSRDVEMLVKKSAANYEMLIHESMNDLKIAKSPEDRQRVYESWRRAQEAQDKLFSLCGIYVKREKKEITRNDVEESPAFKQISGLFEEFLYVMGIDFKRWTTFVKDRALGKENPIDVTGKEVRDKTGEIVPARKSSFLGYDSPSLNLNKYVPDYKEFNSLKAKYMLGNMTQEEEDELYATLPVDQQIEYLEWKTSYEEVLEKNKEDEKDGKERNQV